MTSYHGGKQKTGFRIAEAITQVCNDYDFTPLHYCEPFCGMLGVYRHIPSILGTSTQYHAGDTNKSVIMMWEQSKIGWVPTKEGIELHEYDQLKRSPDSAQRGFAGHQFAFGGQFFNSHKSRCNGREFDIVREYETAQKRVKEISNQLQNVQFHHGSYDRFSNLTNALIYCDPPYAKTSCNYMAAFHYPSFLSWCSMMEDKGNVVCISGYNIPDGYHIIWTKEVAVKVAHMNVRHRIESVFTRTLTTNTPRLSTC